MSSTLSHLVWLPSFTFPTTTTYISLQRLALVLLHAVTLSRINALPMLSSASASASSAWTSSSPIYYRPLSENSVAHVQGKGASTGTPFLASSSASSSSISRLRGVKHQLPVRVSSPLLPSSSPLSCKPFSWRGGKVVVQCQSSHSSDSFFPFSREEDESDGEEDFGTAADLRRRLNPQRSSSSSSSSPSRPIYPPPDEYEREFTKSPATESFDSDDDFADVMELEKSRPLRLRDQCSFRHPRISKLIDVSSFQAAIFSLKSFSYACFYYLVTSPEHGASWSPSQRKNLLYLTAHLGLVGPFSSLHFPPESPEFKKSLVFAKANGKVAFLERILRISQSDPTFSLHASMWALDAESTIKEAKSSLRLTMDAIVLGNLQVLRYLIVDTEKLVLPLLEEQGPNSLLSNALAYALPGPAGLEVIRFLLDQGAPLNAKLRYIALAHLKRTEQRFGPTSDIPGPADLARASNIAIAREIKDLIYLYTAHLV